MFKLNKEISRTTSDIDADDVFKTKKELNNLGYYTPNPKVGMNEFTDEEMFYGIGKFQKDNKLKVDEVMKPQGETENKINEIKSSSISKQIKDATKDMHNNYKVMKKANTKNTDDYYHCKANYEATKRGKAGEITAVVLGNEKEAFDYFKNRARGLSFKEAHKDYWNDVNVNKIGREKAKNNLYSSQEEGCAEYRPSYLKKKHW